MHESLAFGWCFKVARCEGFRRCWVGVGGFAFVGVDGSVLESLAFSWCLEVARREGFWRCWVGVGGFALVNVGGSGSGRCCLG